MSIKSQEARELAQERRSQDRERTLTRNAARSAKQRGFEAFA